MAHLQHPLRPADIGRQVVQKEPPAVDEGHRGDLHGHRIGIEPEMVYPEVDIVDAVGQGLPMAVLIVKSRVPESEIPAGESPLVLAGGIFLEGIGEKGEVEAAKAVAADVEVGAVYGEPADAHLFIGETESVEPDFYFGGGGQGLAVGFLEPDILQNDLVEEGDVYAPDVDAGIELL